MLMAICGTTLLLAIILGGALQLEFIPKRCRKTVAIIFMLCMLTSVLSAYLWRVQKDNEVPKPIPADAVYLYKIKRITYG